MRTNRTTTALIATTVLALNGWAVAPASAVGTATASMSGTTLVINGGAADNQISINLTSSSFITDSSGITAGAGCSQQTPTQVRCPPDWSSPDYVNLTVDLGDGNDTAMLGALIYTHRITITGGTGDDTIYSGDGDDTVSGGDGNDMISGGVGRDSVDGGPGDDTVNGSAGDDRVIGGPGRDSVNGDSGSPLDDGNDRIDIVDGEIDSAQCGFGADTVSADAGDVVEEISCESITRTPAQNVPNEPTQTPSAVGKVTKVVKRHKAKITWVASAGASAYQVRWTKPGATKYRGWRSVVAPSITFTVRKGASYAVQIMPVNAAGSGPVKTVRFKGR